MATTKAQQRAVDKYVKANYDRIEFKAPKGRKAEIKAHADTLGESVNGFINRAVDQAMNGAPSENPLQPPPLAQGIVLPSDAEKAAAKAIETTGEDLTGFVARSVSEQVKRDRFSLQMGLHPVTGEKLKGDSTHE